MYVLDTNVVSELRRPKPHGAVQAWFDAAPAEALYISAVTLGEIQLGIERIRPLDAAKAATLARWADRLAETMHILPADAAVFRAWAILRHGRPDHHLEDALIAATAKVDNFIVVTRNVKDFEPFGVSVLDPFKAHLRP
jgi:predicted nucleic acid-binding protein